MRRSTAVAGVITVLAPLLWAGASTASAAATGSLTVTTLDRTGSPVYAQVAAYNTKTYDMRIIDSNKATTLPDGTYELATSYVGSDGEAGIVGGHSVTVSGSTKTTFDGRQSHAVNVSLSPSPGSGYDHTVTAYVCTADNGPAEMGLTAEAGDVYVIPSSSKAYELGYGATYQPLSETGGDFWQSSALHTGGVPSGLTASLKTSGLTAIKVSARSGPDSGQTNFSFDYSSGDGSGCPMYTNSLQFQRDLPNYFTVHLAPGQWQASTMGNDFAYDGFHAYAAGKTASLTFGHAVWGPGGRLPNTWYHKLYLGYMLPFEDPTLPDGGTLASGTVSLTHSGKTLYSHTYTHLQGVDATPTLPGAGWYTMRMVGHRALPSGSLSTTSSLTLTFYANPATDDQVRDYITRFWPDGLDTRNQAAPGSTTTIVLGMQRQGTDDDTIHQLSDGVKSVRFAYSTDGGTTWHSVTATHSGSDWTVGVHNPSAGHVALRSTVTDTHGDSSTTTVYNAYAVS